MNYLFIITEYFVHALPLMGESYLIAYKIGKTGLHTNTYSQRNAYHRYITLKKKKLSKLSFKMGQDFLVKFSKYHVSI